MSTGGNSFTNRKWSFYNLPLTRSIRLWSSKKFSSELPWILDYTYMWHPTKPNSFKQIVKGWLQGLGSSGENEERLVKESKPPVIKWINSGDLMYSMVITDNIIDNNHIMFLKVANKIDLKCSLSTHSEKDNYVRRWISISNYHVVHLKLIHYFMSIIYE